MTLRTDWEFSAFVHNVVDGDTLDAFAMLADFGFRRYEVAIERFRFLGIDTPEMHGPDRERALAAKARTAELVLHKWVTLKTFKDPEKYGRWLAHVLVRLPDGTIGDVSEILLKEGHAKVKPVAPASLKVDSLDVLSRPFINPLGSGLGDLRPRTE